ncbi:MAG: preprotein translocase subunit SecA [Galactobacillus timonensis]|uniref:preprotein translocase subunit SecA n=1 Tax=Galactobacillus timonensis TaxID=2041840 RepID=UPI002409ED00|nr:preprotein translocase subunit SecA [Galactobacillus timonensis]MDD5850819.1 preprotein translocase subunit SecA [Galactobacillus timonensis]MDD6369848.1 preprotein translocase subunit SecA [Galactobacillus timonensis]MDD6599819.1 preprotein translocase subunit SecA [Galactobacillus timonensis]MDD6680179.1 preprotein translocase subunit SecA [Galactobacillus timonensis]
MANVLTRLFNEDERRLKKIEKSIQPVLAMADKYKAMSDEELKAETPRLKEKLANGATLDDIMCEAFATAREACRRVIGEYPYPVQVIGAAVMQGGDIAEMKTGEGKTLTSVMPAYLNALSGKGVHIVTVNEYLSKRDAEWMGRIHQFLGLSVGYNAREMSSAQKRAAYNCDITYTTNSELGFDYLRDNMVTDAKDRVLRGLNFALIDEVDSILIDESRTPLIISGGMKQTANLYLQADRFVKRLKEQVMGEDDEIVTPGDYVIDIKAKVVTLSEQGVAKAEKVFRVDNLFNLEHTQLLHRINQALKANYIMQKDVDYVVDTENDEIVIVDPNTGRLMKGREWSDGLHQAVCAKEGISIRQETTVLATITYQNFFRLYNKLAGMTGTAKTEEEEFLEIYNMLVDVVPTNKPVIRIDYPDSVYGTKKAKFAALVNEVKERHATGQPVLVGTIAVETSEMISQMLKKEHIPHEVLNAKNNAREAEIIAKAGQKGAVTIATNMAGRGTDIKLGEGVKELGGLCVLGSERHESRRIDNQLRGRAGRQGDPGMSRFYVSVEDDLMVRFGSERYQDLFKRLGDNAIEDKLVTRSISSAQKRVEGVNFDARKTLLQYDDVMRQQREVMYEQRNYILDHEDVHSVIKEMFERVINNVVASHIIPESKDMEVNAKELVDSLDKMGFQDIVTEDELRGKNSEEAGRIVNERAWEVYDRKVEPVRGSIMRWEREMSLKMIDRAWVDHIDTMSKLRDGIGLRSYAQSNPLQAYVTEGYELFENMMSSIAESIVSYCMRLKVVVKQADGTETTRDNASTAAAEKKTEAEQ